MLAASRFVESSALIKGAAAVVALMPGVAALLGVVEVPPSIDALVRFISVFVSLACVFSIALFKASIRKARGATVAITVLAMAIGAAGFATSYFLFARSHVIRLVENAGNTEIYLIPLAPSPAIVSIMAPYDGDYVEALETSSQRLILRQELQEQSGSTAAILVGLLILAQAISIGAVMLGAWKLTSPEAGRGSRGSRQPTKK